MNDLDNLKRIAEKKSNECAIKANAYSLSLDYLFPANLVLVVGAALLSLLAGASVLHENDIITQTTAGLMALVSGCFTVIHSKLGCDQYQSECKKLVSFYKGIAEDYSNLSLIDNAAEFREKMDTINNELSHTIKTSSAIPLNCAIDKAVKQSRDQGSEE